MKKNPLLGFVGLTHLGLSYLAASSKKGYKTIGLDKKKKINQLKKLKIEYKEPNLKKTISINKKRIVFTSSLNTLINCDIVFISQDIDTDDKGKGNFQSLKKLISKISKHLNNKAIMVVLSQVKPGFMRMINFDHNRLYYQVETLIFGKAIERAIKPERLIIGCKNSGSKIDNLYSKYLNKFNCPIIKMNYESAELAKISINLLLSSTVNTTNLLAEASEKINADWNKIIPALRLDKRIGRYAYVKPGLGISGGNLERDIRTIIDVNKKYKINSDYFRSILIYSAKRKNWVWEKLKKLGIEKFKKLNIAILGVAYKEDTDSIKNSPSIDLIKKLIKRHSVTAYDPSVPNNVKLKNFKRVSSVMKAVNRSDIVIFMTAWPEFRNINVNEIRKKMKGKVIIDPFNILNFKKFPKLNKNYYSLGT